jgi:hypothetical protein
MCCKCCRLEYDFLLIRLNKDARREAEEWARQTKRSLGKLSSEQRSMSTQKWYKAFSIHIYSICMCVGFFSTRLWQNISGTGSSRLGWDCPFEDVEGNDQFGDFLKIKRDSRDSRRELWVFKENDSPLLWTIVFGRRAFGDCYKKMLLGRYICCNGQLLVRALESDFEWIYAQFSRL